MSSLFLKKSNLVPNYMIFIIPRWNDLLGTSFKGFYANRIVSKIHLDSVIMFSSLECAVTEKTGTSYFLFGCGLYFLKFELDNGTYILDQRELNGLLLSDFVYDYMATAPQVTLSDDDDVIINELGIKIPLDLSNKTVTKQTFIRGVLMRNIFVPYKEVILRMLEQGQKKESYDVDQTGFKLLSSHPSNYNRILLSEAFKFGNYAEYIKPTAGVSNIHFLADKILNEFFSPEDLTRISKSISSLKEILERVEVDTGFLFSMLETINKELPSK
ncbi:MAG: hypothetical protein HWN66_10195 [Candidatus Helarchaeota archaeon]|nr:hypothetical protein [Candidatus Helarchaeota archaeon]